MSEHAPKRATMSSFAKVRGRHTQLHADVAKALGHPKRLAMVQALADGRERSVTDLQAIAGASQSNVSQNLAVLRAAGLVTTRREGNLVYYRVRDRRVKDAIDILGAVAQEAALDLEPSTARRELGKRRAKVFGVAILATLALTAALAAFHPLLAGGTLGDVARHVDAMAARPDLTTLLTTCRDATASARVANMPMTATLGAA